MRRVRRTGRVARDWKRAARPSRLRRHHSASRTRAGPRTAAVTERNAHPHVSHGEIARGAQRHHREPRASCASACSALGYAFDSETDTEVIAHLIHHYRSAGARPARGACRRAVARAARRLRDRGDRRARPGAHGRRAHGLPAAGRPRRGRELRRLRRLGAPAVDAPGDLPRGRRHRRDHARRRARSSTRDGKPVQRDGARSRDAVAGAVELGEYRHYMQKEIHEQPRAVADTLEGADRRRRVPAELFGVDADARAARRRQRCRSSPAAPATTPGLVARYWIEAIAGIPCSVEIASEYRYRDRGAEPEARWSSPSRSRAKPPTRWRR